MPNTVQAAAEGLPTDTQIAKAMREMETSIYELSHMAHIVTDQLGGVFDSRIITDGIATLKLTSDQIERFMFAAHNVHNRCKALEAKFEAAWNGEVPA